jgi:hypothetical protein
MGAKVKMDESGNILIKRLRKLNTAALSEKTDRTNKFSSFWASNGTRLSDHRAQKTLDFQGPTPSHSPSKCICTHQKHYARGRINHRCINS